MALKVTEYNGSGGVLVCSENGVPGMDLNGKCPNLSGRHDECFLLCKIQRDFPNGAQVNYKK